jgi:hypothetical protein
MLTELVRIHRAWVDDATHGVAVQLAAVPKDANVTRATMPTVYDETLTAVVARGMAVDATALPALCISTTETVLDQRTPVVMPGPYDAEVDLLFRYIVRNVDTEVALAHAGQMQRALLRCLRALHTTSAGQVARVRNEVQVISLRNLRSTWFQSNDDSVVTCGVLCTVQVRDGWATS